MKVFGKAVVVLSIVAFVSVGGLLSASPAYDLDDRQEENREAFGLGTRLVQSGQPSVAPEVAPAATTAPAKSPATQAEPPTDPSVEYGPELPPEGKPSTKDATNPGRRQPQVTRRGESAADTQTGMVRPAVPVAVREHDGAVHGRGRRQDKIALLASRSETKVSTRETVGKTAGTVGVMALKLAFVLALAYATILLLKWVSTRREPGTIGANGSHDLQLMDTVRLSPTSSLHLVNAGGRTLLVGCASGQVNLLREFEPGDTPEGVRAARGKFAEYLEKYSVAGAASTPAARIAGLLRDCTSHLRRHQAEHAAAKSTEKGEADA